VFSQTPAKKLNVITRFKVCLLCHQELGEGAFGKVYKGELTGFLGGMSALVAIKTLKPGEGTFGMVYRGELTGFL
jgi:hypothetical protein